MDFKHLQVYRRSLHLAIDLHKLTSHFPRAGHATLRSQLTRAADSISTNIAEGCGAASKKDMARFLDTSIKSANETEHHLLAARELGLISVEEWRPRAAEVIEIRKMTYVYRKRVLESIGTTEGSAV